jgi:hypothetical protein
MFECPDFNPQVAVYKFCIRMKLKAKSDSSNSHPASIFEMIFSPNIKILNELFPFS